MSRPSVRRALRRAGAEPLPRRPRSESPRNLGRIPPPKIFLPGETEDAGPVDFPRVFGRVAPVEMEIGVGKGKTHSDQRQDLKEKVELREAAREMSRFNQR